MDIIEEYNSIELNSIIKYGELIILGKSSKKFILLKKNIGNGIVKNKSDIITIDNYSNYTYPNDFHTDYLIDCDKIIITNYSKDSTKDIFQIGRCSEITEFGINIKNFKSLISRYSFYILADRNNINNCKIYAGGFDKYNNTFLGDNSIYWLYNNDVDGFTSNGILIMKPIYKNNGDFEYSNWRELSMNGNIHAIRNSRSDKNPGILYPLETNTLIDGTLIDICGITLLWRNNNGLNNVPLYNDINLYIKSINNIKSIANNKSKSYKTYVYINCGHVHRESKLWLHIISSINTLCPTCKLLGPICYINPVHDLSIFIGSDRPEYIFIPCGHIANIKTINYWCSIYVPFIYKYFIKICPFCYTILKKENEYVKLIY